MLMYNEHALPVRMVATVLFASAILANAASAQTAPIISVQSAEVASKIPLDAVRAYSFEHETCDKGKATQCTKSTIFVFSTPLIEVPNVPATSGSVTKYVAGSTLTYQVTATNNGPASASNIKLVEPRRAGVNCPDASEISVISGPALPSGRYTIADLTGPGVSLTKLDLGQSTTLSYSCQVN